MSKESELSLHDLRTLIFMSKYRHKISKVCNGWGFTPVIFVVIFLSIIKVNMASRSELEQELRVELGEELYAARFKGEKVSLW